MERELSRGEMVTVRWMKIVDILFELKEAWGEFLTAQKGASKEELEQLPRSMNKHIGHLLMRATFEKAMPILVQYWGVRGGLNYLRVDERDVPGYEDPVEIKLDEAIVELTPVEMTQKAWQEHDEKGGLV